MESLNNVEEATTEETTGKPVLLFLQTQRIRVRLFFLTMNQDDAFT